MTYDLSCQCRLNNNISFVYVSAVAVRSHHSFYSLIVFSLDKEGIKVNVCSYLYLGEKHVGSVTKPQQVQQDDLKYYAKLML